MAHAGFICIVDGYRVTNIYNRWDPKDLYGLQMFIDI